MWLAPVGSASLTAGYYHPTRQGSDGFRLVCRAQSMLDVRRFPSHPTRSGHLPASSSPAIPYAAANSFAVRTPHLGLAPLPADANTLQTMALIVARHSSPEDWFLTGIPTANQEKAPRRARPLRRHASYLPPLGPARPHNRRDPITMHLTCALRSYREPRVPAPGRPQDASASVSCRGARSHRSSEGGWGAHRPKNPLPSCSALSCERSLWPIRSLRRPGTGREAGQVPPLLVLPMHHGMHQGSARAPQRVLFPASLPVAWLGLRCGQQSTAMARA